MGNKFCANKSINESGKSNVTAIALLLLFGLCLWWGITSRSKDLSREDISYLKTLRIDALNAVDRKDYKKAIELYKLSLDSLPEDNLSDKAFCNNELGYVYKVSGDYAQAEKYYKIAIDIDKANFGDNHPNTAMPMANLGSLYASTQRFDEAEPFLLCAADIYEKSEDKYYFKAAKVLNNLAQIYCATNRWPEAQKLMERGIGILVKYRQTSQKTHPDMQLLKNNYIMMLKHLGSSDSEIKTKLEQLSC